MTTQTESIHALEFLLSEGEGQISRETVTLISGQNLIAGTVLGMIAASGKYTLHDPSALDGSEGAAAILLQDADASGGDMPVAVIKRLGEVSGALLTWKVGITSGQKTNAILELAVINIIVR
jgi:hypothetical protein